MKTGVGNHSLLQGIFPTQGSNPHCRRILYHLSHQGSLRDSSICLSILVCPIEIYSWQMCGKQNTTLTAVNIRLGEKNKNIWDPSLGTLEVMTFPYNWMYTRVTATISWPLGLVICSLTTPLCVNHPSTLNPSLTALG